MRTLMKGIGAGALMSLAAATQAAPMTWTDVYSTPEYVSPWETVSWTHDIRDNGFNAGVDSISGYSITLKLYDDEKDKWWDLSSYEVGGFNQPGLFGDLLFEVQSGDVTAPDTILGRYLLEENGFLKVSLTSLWGDFYFKSSELTAYGETASVPEPGSLALIGIGLVGLGLARRNARKNG